MVFFIITANGLTYRPNARLRILFVYFQDLGTVAYGEQPHACHRFAHWGFVIISYGCKVPAGIFVPSMAIGATFGRMWASLSRRSISELGKRTRSKSGPFDCHKSLTNPFLFVLFTSGVTPTGQYLPRVSRMCRASLPETYAFLGAAAFLG